MLRSQNKPRAYQLKQTHLPKISEPEYVPPEEKLPEAKAYTGGTVTSYRLTITSGTGYSKTVIYDNTWGPSDTGTTATW